MSFRESMLLWLPVSLTSDDKSIEEVTLANGAILDFCDGELSFADTLETIEYYGANVDEYRSGLATDVKLLGA
ncbi:hypothetical protein [Chlorogloea sp. CCALA 695]|uniref:hypothetical protein n=1 Tax=Chlorogloea sp. CCALA 695 TaxID=2107693 RepID=UPI000D05A5C5|nr:hypothetical protein [Chlorogloea sp. CCALA 695]PSB27470.1 hypothetical protein C7B70_22470 [Chlorogloea sp. CCALA 695]